MTENWIELAVGLFLLIAPWVFGFAGLPLARWTDMICGLVLAIMNAWTIYGREPSAEPVSVEVMPETAGAVRRTRRKKADVMQIN